MEEKYEAEEQKYKLTEEELYSANDLGVDMFFPNSIPGKISNSDRDKREKNTRIKQSEPTLQTPMD